MQISSASNVTSYVKHFVSRAQSFLKSR